MSKRRNITDEYFEKFNYELYGGTPILGVNSNVMIAHGKSSALAYKNLMVLSKDIVEANLNEKIKTVFQ
jgi:glycerol-3-phosphate acyltransferase PlsX